MSENLNEVFEEQLDDAQVITVPIDDTLTKSGEAADAYAVGQALADKADKSELQTHVSVNGQEPDAQGLILLDASEIPMTEEQNAESVADAVQRMESRTGADIPLTAAQGAPTIAETIEGMEGATADTMRMSADDDTTVAEKFGEVEAALGTAVKAVQTTGQPVTPDAHGVVKLAEIENAQQLTSDRNVESAAEFIVRTAAGDASISDGQATLVHMIGRQIHTGYVAEVLNLLVIPITRPTPAGLSGELDAAVFEAYVEDEAGTYTMTYGESAWDAEPAFYGVTLTGTPAEGDTVTITWDGENEPVLTISSPRYPEPEIEATIDTAVFRAYVPDSAIIDLYFTTEWSEDPALYGITVTGEPLAGDRLRVNYTKEDRGTITTATPTGLTGTGWNLYKFGVGKTPALRYSSDYGYRIGGAYSAVEWSATEDGVRQQLTVNDGLFDVPADGWLFVSDGDATTTYLYMTWSDWISSVPAFEAHTSSTIYLSTIMSQFPGGLCRIGDIADEIDFNRKMAISRIQRIPYSAAAMAAIIASGRAYDADTNYIYAVRDTYTEFSFELDATYEISDHGLEIVDGTTVAPYIETMYGPNLKNKLEREVLTHADIVNGLTSEATDKALSAAAGAALSDNIANLQDGLAIVANGDTHVNIAQGQFVYVKNHSTLAEGLYTANADIGANVALTTSNLTADTAGGLNALNSKIKYLSFTATSDADGDVVVSTIRPNTHVILSAICSSTGNIICHPFKTSDSVYSMFLTNYKGEKASSNSRTFEVWYMDR